MAPQVTTNVGNWDFFNKHVQQHIASSGNFGSGASTLICVGPPMLDTIAKNLNDAVAEGGVIQAAMPIGMTQSFSLGQQQQIMRIFEIGSWRHYTIAGHSMGSLGLGRVYYSGPSLLKAMYAYYGPLMAKSGSGWSDLDQMYLTTDTLGDMGGIDPGTALTPSGTFASTPGLKLRPGADNFMLNLCSDLFKNPIGILCVFQDNLGNFIGAGYCENCYVTSHSMGVGAESLIISENVQVQFERMLPVRVKLNTTTSNTNAINQL